MTKIEVKTNLAEKYRKKAKLCGGGKTSTRRKKLCRKANRYARQASLLLKVSS